MKQFLGILLFLVIATLQAQPPSAAGAEEPVKLSVSAARDGDGWDIKVTATIEHGWSVYSMNNYGDMGPWPTSIRVDSVAGLALVALLIRWRGHRRLAPVLLAGVGFLLIAFTMLVSYERIIELAGFVFLCAGTVADWRMGRGRKERDA